MNATMMYTPPPSEDIDMEQHTDRSDTSSYACEADNPSFRPYILQADEVKGEEFDITRAKYSTSLDPRGYIPVYEYTVGNQPIMWDRETGFVHFTGIWKCLGNSKADIVRVVDSNPELGVTKIRGGFLKIQGTWMPFEFAKILCLRTAYRIRTKLIPLFGPDFVRQCLPPSHEDYGCLLLDPRSAPPSRSSSHRRSTTAHHATAPSTTARRVPRSEPYQRRPSCTSRPRRSSRTVRSASTSSSASSTSSSTTMSVARLLNDDMLMMGPQPTPSSSSSTTSSHRDSRSPTPVPSPSFTHLDAHKGYMHAYHHLPGPRLPPIRAAKTTTYQHLLPVLRPLGDITVAPPSPSELAVQVSSSLPMGDDLNDTIRTALLLQRLSADTGERPFSTYEPYVLPKRVTVNDQVYTVSWEP
ncbi:DNA-binding domain of Mlu1-box binding protein MBP1 [Lichtheimia hyalospora FSU 10163]|nr:DNA-binding domain of Mlu1-box binding protein MBP1 [Lichtheimia hyalospora FSU 10163]